MKFTHCPRLVRTSVSNLFTETFMKRELGVFCASLCVPAECEKFWRAAVYVLFRTVPAVLFLC